jgi:RNA polymerase sigma-70 factor (ECF subfamily)
MDDTPRAERFERLYTTYYASVLAYALRRASRTEADDVVAETFTIAWRRLADVPDEALPWLYEVARRVLANRRRAEARRGALLDRLRQVPAMTRPSGDLRSLASAFATLPDHEREALALVTWEGLSTAEAARAAGCSDVALRVRLHRARRRLRRALADSEPAVANPATRMEPT